MKWQMIVKSNIFDKINSYGDYKVELYYSLLSWLAIEQLLWLYGAAVSMKITARAGMAVN